MMVVAAELLFLLNASIQPASAPYLPVMIQYTTIKCPDRSGLYNTIKLILLIIALLFSNQNYLTTIESQLVLATPVSVRPRSCLGLAEPLQRQPDSCAAEERQGIAVEALPALAEMAAAVQPGDSALHNLALRQYHELARVAPSHDLNVHAAADPGQALLELRSLITAVEVKVFSRSGHSPNVVTISSTPPGRFCRSAASIAEIRIGNNGCSLLPQTRSDASHRMISASRVA